MASRFECITAYLDEVGSLLSSIPLQPIDEIIDALLLAHRYGRTIYVIGNGGSAATASHFACDLQKWTISTGQHRVRAVALTDNMPIFSAWANDEGYDQGFEQQLRALLNPGDVVVAISGSGRSPNVINAVQYAAAQGAITIGLTGYQGGELLRITDHCVVVPSERMNQIEDVHMTLCHLIADMMRRALAQRDDLSLARSPSIGLQANMTGA
ncbi:D-sedoheptulose-7-phosphate isomerase [Kallotenue papyrolyticum]|uniref:D-sedoheptulose-7-phosphate isomerase n=1 Tax=Kallotenue papyrolyticum TaxID=1325125 RepID=UPI00047860B6|nr:SIS domain-containing protein [Kallotenue papyrolyticum]